MAFLRSVIMKLIQIFGTQIALKELKKRGMIAYLKTLQAARKSLLAVLLVFCFVQLMIIGAVGTFVTAVLLSNQDPAAKLWILLGGFLAILVIPLITLVFALSERSWFKFSGAESFFNDKNGEESETTSSKTRYDDGSFTIPAGTGEVTGGLD
jgi:hypothetical protein